jgi:hypothetical protein
MSIRAIPQQFRIYCDLRLTSDCLGYSRYLMMNLAQAEDFMRRTDEWSPLALVEGETGAKHGCRNCIAVAPDRKLVPDPTSSRLGPGPGAAPPTIR